MHWRKNAHLLDKSRNMIYTNTAWTKHWFCALYLLHLLSFIAWQKKALPFQSTDRAHWSNGVDECSKCKHATIKQQWQSSDTMANRHRQIDIALIQWHTGIVRLTALWSNGKQASSDWQRSDTMANRHRQIDSALIQWHTGIVRLTSLWSNGIQASSDWQRSDTMANRHRQIDSALIQWHTGIVRLTSTCAHWRPFSWWRLLGRSLARLTLEAVLLEYKMEAGPDWIPPGYITFCYNNTIRSAVTVFRTVKYNENKTNQN